MGTAISFTESGPGVVNLLTIYQALSEQTKPEIEKHFEGQGYGTLKRELVERVTEFLAPVQKEVRRLLDDPAELDRVLRDGSARARSLASPKMKTVYQHLGIDTTFGPQR
jgi:tryptophanyl-tRNA synthetase